MHDCMTKIDVSQLSLNYAPYIQTHVYHSGKTSKNHLILEQQVDCLKLVAENLQCLLAAFQVMAENDLHRHNQNNV